MVGAVSARIRVVLFSEVNSKFGAPFLDALSHDPRVSLTALVTSPPGQVCDYYVGEPKPVDLEARAHEQGIPVHRPASVNDASSVARLRELHADYHLIGNFQQIFKPELLAVPIRATVNFHPSPLPRYAGLAPFFWMARNGERHGGASALIAKPLVDAGPLLARKYIPLDGTETAGEIRNLHFTASVELLHLVLPRLVDHDLAATPQDLARRTYFGRPSPDDRRVDWKADTETVLRTIRACLPRILEHQLGLLDWQVGLIAALAPAGLVLASRVSGSRISRIGPWALMTTGMIVMVGALALLTVTAGLFSLPIIGVLLFVYGIGGGLFQPANIAAVMAAAGRGRQGTIGAAQRLVLNIGIGIGTTVSTALLPVLAGGGASWGAAGGLSAIGVLTLQTSRRRRHTAHS